jgi:hypothetical protein
MMALVVATCGWRRSVVQLKGNDRTNKKKKKNGREKRKGNRKKPRSKRKQVRDG